MRVPCQTIYVDKEKMQKYSDQVSDVFQQPSECVEIDFLT
jgi:hypothetical protein